MPHFISHVLERTGSDGLRTLSFPSGKAACSGHNSHESSIRTTNSRGSCYGEDGQKLSRENVQYAQLLKNGVPLKVFSRVYMSCPTLDNSNTVSH